MCRGYYSPKIKEDYIPFLYYLARYLGVPMTHLVNEIVGNVIGALKDKDKKLLAEFEAIKARDEEYTEILHYLSSLVRTRSRKTRTKIIKMIQEVKNERDIDASGR